MLCEQIISIEHKDIEYKLLVNFWFEEDLTSGTGSQYGKVDYYEIKKLHQIQDWNGKERLCEAGILLNDDDFTNEVVEALKLIREESKNVASRENY